MFLPLFMFLSLLVLRTRVVDRAKSGISHGGSMSVKVGAKLRETDDDSGDTTGSFGAVCDGGRIRWICWTGSFGAVCDGGWTELDTMTIDFCSDAGGWISRARFP